MSLKQYSEAIIDFNCAIELDSSNDSFLYKRAIAYHLIGQPNQTKTELKIAINLAKTYYQQDPKNFEKIFHLALYHLASEYSQAAEKLYQYALSHGASVESILSAIQGLNNFLYFFPSHIQAQSMRQFLQSYLA
jgi:tetratricopeptide (TPR) repeat protein